MELYKRRLDDNEKMNETKNELSIYEHSFFLSIHFDRFTVTSTHTSNDDLLKDWAEIRKVSTELLDELNIHITDRARVHLKGICFSFLSNTHLRCLSCRFVSFVTTQSLQRHQMDFKLKPNGFDWFLLSKSYDENAKALQSKSLTRKPSFVPFQLGKCFLFNTQQ